MSLNDFCPLTLDLAVIAGAIVVLLADLFLPARRGRLLGWLTFALLGGVFTASFLVDTNGTAAYGAYQGGAWVLFFKRLFLGAGMLEVLGIMDHLENHMPRRQGEYYLLMLLSMTGMMILPGARDLLLLVVCFELMGIPLYVMAGYAKTDGQVRGGPRSPAAEASLKLYLIGAASTAITMFGMSIVVGFAGTTSLAGIGAVPITPLFGVGLLLIFAGFGFKIGLVPFHMWVPDTYQGAPTPFVAFLSVAPKAGGLAAVSAVFLVGMAGKDGPWWPAIGAIAALTMTAGNLFALPQTDVRRLLGYSGVAQMGYVLVAIATRSVTGMGVVLFFMAGYVVTNMGAFLVLHAVAESSGGHDLTALRGLARRSPWLGGALLVFLLSLAGIPFVIGFWAKLYVFLAAYEAGLIGLVVLGALLAVVGLFYYMQVARAAYMAELPKEQVTTAPHIPAPLKAAILVCLLAVVGMGLWPRPLFDAAERAGQSVAPSAMAPR